MGFSLSSCILEFAAGRLYEGFLVFGSFGVRFARLLKHFAGGKMLRGSVEFFWSYIFGMVLKPGGTFDTRA